MEMLRFLHLDIQTKPMKTLISTLIVGIGVCYSAFSYPIDPRPLRKLIIESEYIVVGYVVKVVVPDPAKNRYPSHVAHIRVDEVLQGEIGDDVIKVGFSPYVICPAPAQYEENTHVIVFLDRHKQQFITHAMSYGVKTLEPDELNVYKPRIREMQTILDLKDADDRFIQTVEWLVKCVEHEATRWEGAYELNPDSDFMSFYARSELPPFQYILTAEQKQRLKDAILHGDSQQYANFGIVDLVYAGNEEEVYEYLLKSLKSLPENSAWLAGEYMTRLQLRKNNEKMDKLIAEFESVVYELNEAEEMKRIISEFIAVAER